MKSNKKSNTVRKTGVATVVETNTVMNTPTIALGCYHCHDLTLDSSPCDCSHVGELTHHNPNVRLQSSSSLLGQVTDCAGHDCQVHELQVLIDKCECHAIDSCGCLLYTSDAADDC